MAALWALQHAAEQKALLCRLRFPQTMQGFSLGGSDCFDLVMRPPKDKPPRRTIAARDGNL